ncbi:MAG: hypothetical protein ABI425_02945 [Patescibacteria group bacterium]
MSNIPDRLTAAFSQVKKDVKMLTSSQTYSKMSQNQIIGGLTMLLLTVGVAAGVYLGQISQENRQQAFVPYDTCVSGDSNCIGHGDGFACSSNGRCALSQLTGSCSCDQTNPIPTGTISLGCSSGQEFLNENTCNAICGGGCIQGGIGYCCVGTGPTSTPALDNGCAASGGTCKGTCGASDTQTGLCSGSSSGPKCCKPVLPTATLFCWGAGTACGNSGGSASCCPGLSCTIDTSDNNTAKCTAPANCGNNVCSQGENCTTCPTDCGLCPQPTNTPVPVSSCPSGETCVETAGTCGGIGGSLTSNRCGSGNSQFCCLVIDSCPSGETCVENVQACGIIGGTTTSNRCGSEQDSKTCCKLNSGPSAAPRPTNTPVPLPTNTSVPVSPGQPTNTPVPNPNPTNTSVPVATDVLAPVCVNITMNNPASLTPNTPPNTGDVVTFTCSQVAGASRYEFRVKLPDNSYVNINPSLATLYVSQQYQIPSAGTFTAACRPCNANACSAWEN